MSEWFVYINIKLRVEIPPTQKNFEDILFTIYLLRLYIFCAYTNISATLFLPFNFLPFNM